MSAAATASDMTLGLLLHPERANRMIQQKSLDANQLSLEDMLQQVINGSFGKTFSDTYKSEVQQLINERVLIHLMNLAVNDKSFLQVKVRANNAINTIINYKREFAPYSSHYEMMINEFREHPEKFKIENTPKIPDGSPIGSDLCNYNSN